MTEPDVAPGLSLRVDELAAHVAQLTSELTDLSAAVFSGPATSGPATVAEPMYDTLDGWVGEYFAPTFTRPIGGEIRWCTQWAEHAEAVTRLEALWRSWETLRLDPAVGMATWLTNYLDPQLAALLSRSGTFAQCQPDRHSIQAPLPVSRAQSRPD